MIHPSSVIDPSAKLADDVSVGPFCVIGPDVEIGAGTVLESHVVVKGPSVIGKNNHFYQFATIGEDTPDKKYKGEPTRLEMGDGNIIREAVTIHRGTVQDKSLTKIGDDNLIMAYAHVGHDSFIGSHTIIVNNTSIAGHVEVGDWAILSGHTMVHQGVNIGAHSFTGAGTFLSQDLPAYVTATGHPASARTINKEGLKRRGFSAEAISAINKAYKIFYRKGLSVDEALEQLAPLARQHSEVQLFIDSIKRSVRGVTR